jgi:2-aminoethylphosphonate-pyruvate transaminase
MYEVLENGLQMLGFRFLVEKKYRAKILTAIIEPEDKNYCFSEMHDFLYKRGFTIYPGKGAMQSTFRLANMGAITKHDITKLLGHLEEYVVKKDIKLSPPGR